ncbi:MAG: nicotinate-nucleotide adenylyltransferase [Ktedonobacteraceae bacterium]
MSDQQLVAEESVGERTGLLGGTFDPVHYAHLAIAEEVYAALKLTRVLFVPAGQPPHKQGDAITPVQQRLAMLELAIAGNTHFEISLVDVQRAGPSYTVDTLRLLRQEWGPRAEFSFIIGGDSLEDLPDWYKPAEILAQATLVALMRPGYAEISSERRARLEARLPALKHRLISLEGPRMDISSTELRQRVAEGRPIRYQVPDAVEEYILREGLYRNNNQGHWPEQDYMHVTNGF